MDGASPPQPHILAIRGGADGDFTHPLPAIRLLRLGIPGARVSVLGYPSIAELALLSRDACAIHSLEHGAMAPLFAPSAVLEPNLRQFFASFPLVVSWLYDPDGIFTQNLTRCGVKTVLQGEHRVDPSLGIPAAAQLAKPLEQLALYLEEPFIHFPPEALHRPASLRSASLSIAIHPGSGSPRKNWGYENWAVAASLLHRALPGAHFRIVSGEAEEETIPSFLHLLHAGGIDSFSHERQSLPELAATLASSQLFLGHDSGISHLAAATGIPCGLVFGPTSPATWAPRNPRVRVLHKPSGSLAQISPHEVLTLALDLLARQTS